MEPAQWSGHFCQFNCGQQNTPCKCLAYKGLLMGPRRFELLTSSLSGTRSNQLSYEPGFLPLPIRSTGWKAASDCMADAGRVNWLGTSPRALPLRVAYHDPADVSDGFAVLIQGAGVYCHHDE